MTNIAGTEAERQFTLERLAPAGRKAVTYRASLSSETPVKRFFGTEILDHSSEAIDLSRTQPNGLALLFNHDVDSVVGRVKNIRLDASTRRLVGDLTFGRSAKAKEVKDDVDDGVLTDVSVRYQINEAVPGDGDPDEILVTNWTPFEVSVVSVPADPNVGIGRGKDMSTKSKGGGDVVDIETARSDGRDQERQRIAEIETLFLACRHKGIEFDRLRAECIRKGSSLEQAQRGLLDLMNRAGDDDGEPTGARGGAGAGTYGGRFPHVSGGDINSELGPAAVDGFLARAGIPVEKPHPGAQDFTHKRIVDVAEACLIAAGKSTRGWAPNRIIGEALQMRSFVGHTTSDFPGILANVADKAMSVGFQEIASQHRAFIRLGELRDFKPASRVALSEFSNLEVVPEHSEYKHGTYAENAATLTAAKYGKLFAITREALINDDAGAFTAVPRGMAAAAARIERDKVFDTLVSGIAPDGNSVWTGHNNTGTAGAPSVTTLDEARKLMRVQKGPNDAAVLDAEPKFLIVPAALETTAKVLVAAQNDPAEGTTTAFSSPNPFRGVLEVITSAYLDGSSATAWYLAADPNIRDTIELAHVGGQSRPYLESRDGWTIDGVEYKVRHEFAVGIIDYRALVKNAGS